MVIGPGTIGLLIVAWAKTLNPSSIIVVGLDRINEPIARSLGATHFSVVGEDPLAFIQGGYTSL